jgi:hypothetical protein
VQKPRRREDNIKIDPVREIGYKVDVKLVPCHRGTARHQVADARDGPQTLREAANILMSRKSQNGGSLI